MNKSNSIKYLLLTLTTSIFISETLVMLLIDMLPPLLKWQESLLDATLLSILVFPAIYLFAFRPLKIQIANYARSEAQLRIAAIAFEGQAGIMITDANANILKVNKTFTKLTGYSNKDVIGKNPRMLSSGRHDANFYSRMWENINNTGSWEGEIWNERKNGDKFLEHIIITAVKDVNNIISNYVGTLTDITASDIAAKKIKHLAFYDPLTGLPNRALLQDRLKLALASTQRNELHGALLFIDLDNFKSLNDTLGHNMGDLMLQQVAERLLANVREIDTVARLGGDEFVVVLENLSEDVNEAAGQAELISNKILEALSHPYSMVIHNYQSTASIGITLFNRHKKNIDELLKQADIAMYQAKASGRDKQRFFDVQMQTNIENRVLLEKQLQQALVENQFILYYQPQVRHNGQIIGAEVLVRWRHPQRDIVSPLDFIPLAEETGLILPIGKWVVNSACAQIKKWENKTLTQHLQLAVNISARQFHQTNFVDEISQIIDHIGIKPEKLKLELTETLVLDDIDDTIVKMTALREIGVHFSMDDFGTGYSSLSNLKKLPFDQIKIDQSFVRDIINSPDDAIIVQTIIAMAQNFNIDIIAEGVETEEQRAFLEQHNCPTIQGYLFGKPMPIEQFELLLNAKPNRT